MPPKGLSGVIRKYSYATYSEARAAHWLLLLAADRVDSLESTLQSFETRHPENPLVGTGLKTEFTHHGFKSRFGAQRVDAGHQLLDPIVVAGPWLAVGWFAYALLRRSRKHS